MADYGKKKVDIYNVLDEDGNVEYTLRFPEGSSMYNQAERAREEGRETYVYKPGLADAEKYLMAADAKVDVSIDPVAGTVTLDGPSWLTSTIANSDSFKKNYSENKTLMSAINLYRADPNAKFADDKDGNPISAASAIGQFSDMANAYANSYTAIETEKASAKKRLGVNWTDEDVYIANTSYNKDDYKGDELVYVPKKAMEEYDFTKLDSWNAKNRTISAKDLFENVYKESLFGDEDKGAHLRNWAVENLEDLLQNNIYDRDDESMADRTAEIESSEYASEAARSMHFYKLLSQNKAEMSAAADFVFGSAAAAIEFTKYLQEGGLSLSAWTLDLQETVNNFVFSWNVPLRDVANDVARVTNMLNPTYLSAWMMGEVFSAPYLLESTDNFKEYVDAIQSDIAALATGETAEMLDARRQEIDALFTAFQQSQEGLTDAWARGEFVGMIAYKIFENVALLEVAGGMLEGTIASLGKSGGFVARAVSKLSTSAKTAKFLNDSFKVAGTGANIVVQGILETMIDDRDVLTKAYASGQLSDEALEAIEKNVLWNAIGAGAGWFTGKGAASAVPWLVENTSGAKVATMIGWKATHKAATIYDSALNKVFKTLNRGDWTVAAAKNASDPVAMYTASTYRALAENSKTMSKLRILKKNDPELIRRLEAGWDMIDPERNLLKNLSDNGDVTAKSLSKLDPESADRITQNYIAMSKTVLTKANLQNQIDMISKGAAIRMSEINNYGKEAFEENNRTLREVLEKQAKTKGLTYVEDGGGFILSKEASNWMSSTSQFNRFNNRVKAAGENGANWKKAGFTSKKEYTDWVNYRDALAANIAKLEKKLGPELTQLLDNHLVAAARYTETIDNYMISREYYDIDYARKIQSWRSRGDWNGADGQSRFIHTARMVNDEKSAFEFLKKFDNPASYARNSLAAESKAYVPGDMSDFMDPTLVTQMYLRSAAAVAQAQELGRAIYAAGVPVQKIENFGEDGLTKADVSVITKDVKALQRAFYDSMNASGVKKALAGAIKTNATIQEGVKLSAKGLEAEDSEFTVRTNKASGDMVDGVVEKMKGNEDFNNVVKKMVDAGAKESDAQQYVVLYHMSKLKAKDFTISVDDAKSLADVGKKTTQKVESVNKKTGEAIKKNIDSRFRILQGNMSKDALDAMDIERYFGDIQKEIDEVEALGIYVDKDGFYKLNDYGKEHIIQLIDKEGNLRFYKADPLYASLVNEQPNYYFKETDTVRDFFYRTNGFVNNVFRYGTTGIDRISYFNQWAKDSIDANIIGAGRFFTNLSPSGGRQIAGAAIQDVGGIGGSLGQRVFGETATESFTKEFVDEVFDSSETTLKALYGEEYLDGIKTSVTKGLTGDAATDAYQRAIVERYISVTGYESLPNIGAMTQAKFYRQSAERPKPEEVTSKELRAEYYRSVFKEDKDALKKFGKATKKMREKFNGFLEDTSRGSWRESFWRKNVYTNSYKNALAAGNTPAEAKIFATRYALDSTTDFTRAFAYGNRFIRSVPYLGASINGMKSFMRLLELDPLGLAARFTFGVTIPYTALLIQTLSDPKNLEAYKNLPEYIKQDNLIFAYNGAIIKIPFPDQLADILSPFRHMVEKSVGAQDNSWAKLLASDVLQLSPVDLSGFVELDANAILTDAEGGNGMGQRIGRGFEKTISSLLGPIGKTAWMAATGRDPYTGYKIDKSWVVYDEEGNETIMDSSQSAIAKKVNETWSNIPASAAESYLKTLLGRSTLSVLDNATDILFNGIVNQNMTIAQIGERILNAPTEAFEKAYTTDKSESRAPSDWKSFQSAAYDKKRELVNDESFQKAYKAVQTSEPGTEKYKNALAKYNEKLDEYTNFVLNGTKSFKEHYPDYYTTNRAAQVISMLSLDTGLTLREAESSNSLRNEQYWDARNAAIDTYVKMGFPKDYAGVTVFGTGYYDKDGKFDFRFFTPYEIEALKNDVMGTPTQIQAIITSALSDAGIDKNDMWTGYYDAQTKADKKAYKDEWNAKVVQALYPVIQRYSAQTIINNSDTVDLLDNYIFVDNPYKTKQYIKAIFEGGE